MRTSRLYASLERHGENRLNTVGLKWRKVMLIRIWTLTSHFSHYFFKYYFLQEAIHCQYKFSIGTWLNTMQLAFYQIPLEQLLCHLSRFFAKCHWSGVTSKQHSRRFCLVLCFVFSTQVTSAESTTAWK